MGSITLQAVEALWATAELEAAGVPNDYLSAAIKEAATAARLTDRCEFHLKWLEDIQKACAPQAKLCVTEEMTKVLKVR